MPGIKRFKLTNFPLTPAQSEEFHSSFAIKIQLLKGHEYLDIKKDNVYRAHINGSDRPPITVKIKKVSKDGTVVTLERKRRG
ncbi:MAG: hypothetical protein Q7S08_01655 [bacterium]|nr:hypothetical protein [bacterium]